MRKPARHGFKPAASTMPRATPTPSRSASIAAQPGAAGKEPFVIPVAMGLVAADGRNLNLHLEGEAMPMGHNTVLVLSEKEQTFTFVHVPVEPVPSLRGFSAPVVLEAELSDEALFTLLAHDLDPSTVGKLGRSWPCAACWRRWQVTAMSSWMRSLSRPCATCCATQNWMPPSRSWC